MQWITQRRYSVFFFQLKTSDICTGRSISSTKCFYVMSVPWVVDLQFSVGLQVSLVWTAFLSEWVLLSSLQTNKKKRYLPRLQQCSFLLFKWEQNIISYRSFIDFENSLGRHVVFQRESAVHMGSIQCNLALKRARPPRDRRETGSNDRKIFSFFAPAIYRRLSRLIIQSCL